MGEDTDAEVRKLTGRWIHAHEEDRPGRKVYRSEAVPLPPSRGRSALNIRADGTVSRQGIAADDRADGDNAATGSWTLGSDDNVELVFQATRRGATTAPTAPFDRIMLHLDGADPTRLIEER